MTAATCCVSAVRKFWTDEMNQEAAAVSVLTVLLGCADHPTLCGVLDVNSFSICVILF